MTPTKLPSEIALELPTELPMELPKVFVDGVAGAVSVGDMPTGQVETLREKLKEEEALIEREAKIIQGLKKALTNKEVNVDALVADIIETESANSGQVEVNQSDSLVGAEAIRSGSSETILAEAAVERKSSHSSRGLPEIPEARQSSS